MLSFQPFALLPWLSGNSVCLINVVRSSYSQLEWNSFQHAGDFAGAGGFSGFGGGLPKGFEKILQDPEVMELLQDEAVLSAYMDITKNPANISKHLSNPKVMKLFAKIGSATGGFNMGSGSPQVLYFSKFNPDAPNYSSFRPFMHELINFRTSKRWKSSCPAALLTREPSLQFGLNHFDG